MIAGVATLAVAAVGMAAVVLYSTSSGSVMMLSKTHTLVSCLGGTRGPADCATQSAVPPAFAGAATCCW